MKEHYLRNHGCTAILHIGGHKGQEAPLYDDLGLRFTFVEANPRLAEWMIQHGMDVIATAVSSEKGMSDFYIPRVSERSSLGRLDDGRDTPREIIQVPVVPLNTIQDGYDGLVIDAQGETFDILVGGHLSKFKVIIAEVSNVPRYKGERSREAVNTLLGEWGFVEVAQYKHKNLDIYDVVWIQEQS